MPADTDDFEWHGEAPKRRVGPVALMCIVAGCAAAGMALSHFQTLEKVVSAFERNGVPPQEPAPPAQAAVSPERATVASTQAPIATTAMPEPPSSAAPKPVLINPGTVEEERPAPAASATDLTNEEKPPPRQRNADRRSQHHTSSDRTVLVVVRRVGPPFDTKVLRGRISNGRLIVDSRDRRGLTIR
jgi:hypothetical protein